MILTLLVSNIKLLKTDKVKKDFSTQTLVSVRFNSI